MFTPTVNPNWTNERFCDLDPDTENQTGRFLAEYVAWKSGKETSYDDSRKVLLFKGNSISIVSTNRAYQTNDQDFVETCSDFYFDNIDPILRKNAEELENKTEEEVVPEPDIDSYDLFM